MPEPRVHRRLAAILAADVVGYSRLMGEDEAGTLSALKSRRQQILEPMLSQHSGRVVKLMGDGVLAEFASAVDAVQCALALQDAYAAANQARPQGKSIVLRIGINIGDVIVEGDDIYGDGVNIAARLEALAQPGGICVAAKVYDEVSGKIAIQFNPMGPQQLKNIDQPVHVYALSATNEGSLGSTRRSAAVLPEQPSIAVLPFSSMRSDPEQEFFADGLTEDLITDLSRTKGLFVIARNSTFAYKGKAIDARQIAKELGVRYLLEGSARRSANRIRINVQLIDAANGSHIWADRFDRDSADVFAVQDEVTARIVQALAGQLTRPASRWRPKNLEAHSLCTQARPLMERSGPDAQEAAAMLQKAIALEPNYAEAHALLAQCYWLHWAHFGAPEGDFRARALNTARGAVLLDPLDAGGHSVLGLLLAYEGEWQEAEQELTRAVEIDPNCADAWANLSDIMTLSGRTAEGLDCIRRAMRLNPRPESWYYLLLGQAEYAEHNYEAAIAALQVEETHRTNARKFLAASLAKVGRLEDAKHEAQMFMIGNPHWSISQWTATQPLRDNTVLDHFVSGFRAAGLPE